MARLDIACAVLWLALRVQRVCIDLEGISVVLLLCSVV